MQYSLFQYILKLTSLPAVGIDVHCASLGDWLPSAAGNALPITLLISAALSRLQKLSGTCTPDAFAAEPFSCEHPAITKTAAATTDPTRVNRIEGKPIGRPVTRSAHPPSKERELL